MDFDLSDEQQLIRRRLATSPTRRSFLQQLIRETAREFTDKEIVPRARENDRNHHFDTELVRKIADQGYLGAIVPREYGGAGLDYLTYAIVVEEIGRGCSAMRTVVSVQTSLVCSLDRALGHRGAEAALPAEAVLRRVARLLRADRARHRLRRRQPATRAKKVDGGWEITGTKMWISLGNHAKVALIFAQTDPEQGPPRPRRVPRRRPTSRGFSSRRRSTARWACTAPTPRRSRSTTSRSTTTRCSARSATASRSR